MATGSWIAPAGDARGSALEVDPAATMPAIARREGWPARDRRRGGASGVIALWVERVQMLELLTPATQAEHAAGMTPFDRRRMLETAPLAA